MKVLGIGESVIDNLFVGYYESTNNVLLSNSTSKHVGGSVLSALVVLRRLGIECTLMTTIGKDLNGEIIEQFIGNERIHLMSTKVKKTKVNKILVNRSSGERVKIRGEISHPFIENLNSDFLNHFDAVIIDRHEKLAFYEIVKIKNSSTKLFIDPSTEVSNLTLDMIRYSDYPIIPIEILTQICNTGLNEALKKLYSKCKKTIVVTAGELGSIIYDGSNIENVKASKITPTDVNGAGDVYRGAFAYGILKGFNIRESAKFANIIAGMKCRKLGNTTAIPSKTELESVVSKVQGVNQDFLQIEK